MYFLVYYFTVHHELVWTGGNNIVHRQKHNIHPPVFHSQSLPVSKLCRAAMFNLWGVAFENFNHVLLVWHDYDPILTLHSKDYVDRKINPKNPWYYCLLFACSHIKTAFLWKEAFQTTFPRENIDVFLCVMGRYILFHHRSRLLKCLNFMPTFGDWVFAIAMIYSDTLHN